MFLILLARFLCLSLLISWTFFIHQIIHLNSYQFLAAWKTRGFIQTISINCLCSVEQHLSDINTFSIFSCESDNARMVRDGRDIDNIDIETSHESAVSPPIRDHEGPFLANQRKENCKGWHPYSCRVAIPSHHQNISAQYFTITGKFNSSFQPATEELDT